MNLGDNTNAMPGKLNNPSGLVWAAAPKRMPRRGDENVSTAPESGAHLDRAYLAGFRRLPLGCRLQAGPLATIRADSSETSAVQLPTRPGSYGVSRRTPRSARSASR